MTARTAFPSVARRVLLSLGLLVLGWRLAASGTEPIVAGPLFHEFDLTLDSGRRTESFGPLFSAEERESGLQWTWTPLLSYRLEPEADVEEFDFAYPLLTYDRFGEQYHWQLFQLFSLSGGHSVEGSSRRRTTVFPLYFQQRSSDPNREYTAFIPFYGHIRHRLFRDEIKFVLLPLYLQTQKRDVVTDNYLAPFFHLRHGTGLHGWQFWPLVGYESKAVTSRTNSLDELEIVGGHDKFFALWPIFFREHTALGTENPESQNIFLPFYSLTRSPQRDSSTYLWPVYTVIEDREKKFRQLDLVGPLVQFARGEGKTSNRVWPLFSQVKKDGLEGEFYLWPLYKHNRAYGDVLERNRTRILFFLYSDLTEQNRQTGATLHRTDFFPFFTWQRDLAGNERLQCLAIAEPILRHNKAIERNYSPLWSFWRAERNARTGATSQSLFWNLYRRDATPTAKKCSLLFGLFQYRADVEGRSWRVFYLPVGAKHTSPPPSP